MTLVYELDVCILKVYLLRTIKVSVSGFQKLHPKYDRQTDTTERITTPHLRVVDMFSMTKVRRLWRCFLLLST